MIVTFKHKSLQQFFEKGTAKGFDAKLAKRLQLRLDVMNAATDLVQMNRAGWDLHQLKGERAGTWSLSVNGPWRLTFEWDEDVQDCLNVDLEQYH